jgi:hypothetical protein
MPVSVSKKYFWYKAHGYLRVIDESGENYAYAADRFLRLELSPQVEQTLLAVL